MKLTIGEKIALRRKKRKVTQTELAEYLYLTPQTVSRWEVGSGTPEVTLLPRIATFFGVSIDELFGVTSLERTEDLAVKYSILRDDSSLREAMEQIETDKYGDELKEDGYRTIVKYGIGCFKKRCRVAVEKEECEQGN